MGLFSKNKSKDSLRPLSEVEIQKKLYGSIRAVEPAKIKKAEKQSTYESIEAPKAAVSFAKKEMTEVSHHASHTKKEHFSSHESSYRGSDDLFSTKYEDEKVEKQEHYEEESLEKFSSPEEIEFVGDDPIQQKEVIREKNIMARLAEIAEQEKKKEAELKAASSPRPELIGMQTIELKQSTVKADSSLKKQKEKKENLFLLKLATVSILAGKAAFSFLSTVVFGLINLSLKLFKIIDFRKSNARRVVYWVGGIVCLVLLFGGIHLLNVKREVAMKAPRQKKVSNTIADKNANVSTSKAKDVKKVPVNSEVLSKNVEGQSASVQETVSQTKKEDAKKKESSSEKPTANLTGEDNSNAGRYVIQIATYAGPNDSERVVKQLRAANLESFMKALTRSNGKVYYSVFLGRYNDFEAAQAAFAKFRKNDAAAHFEDAFIRTLNQ